MRAMWTWHSAGLTWRCLGFVFCCRCVCGMCWCTDVSHGVVLSRQIPDLQMNNLVDCAGMLWKLELYGCNVEDRWAAIHGVSVLPDVAHARVSLACMGDFMVFRSLWLRLCRDVTSVHARSCLCVQRTLYHGRPFVFGCWGCCVPDGCQLVIAHCTLTSPHLPGLLFTLVLQMAAVGSGDTAAVKEHLESMRDYIGADPTTLTTFATEHAAAQAATPESWTGFCKRPWFSHPANAVTDNQRATGAMALELCEGLVAYRTVCTFVCVCVCVCVCALCSPAARCLSVRRWCL